MEKYFRQLADVNRRLSEAVGQLRAQQEIVPGIDCPRTHNALLTLLSNALRQFRRLEDQRNRLLKRIADYLPARHTPRD